MINLYISGKDYFGDDVDVQISALMRVTPTNGTVLAIPEDFWYSIPWKHYRYFEMYVVVRYVSRLRH